MRVSEHPQTDFRALASAARVQRATELLRHMNGSITRVSAELGYSSPANFARAFRQATGNGPREFRSNYHDTARPLSIRQRERPPGREVLDRSAKRGW
jgi:transcriptional regulator GlxA family with amidase domain